MSQLRARHSKEEFAKLGGELYDRYVRPNVRSSDDGKFVAIDIDTGAYEIDINELVASDRLFARHPESQVWLTRVGIRNARRYRYIG